MVKVAPLFVGPEFVTKVWLTERATNLVDEHCRKKGKAYRGVYLKELARWCMTGFAVQENAGHVRHEGQGVYRLDLKGDLFRLIGFYYGPGKERFIIIDGFLKRGQRLDATDRERIGRVATIRQNRQWIY